MGEATVHWHMASLFDTLCQLAYMIYITNVTLHYKRKRKINILSITSGCS